MGMARALPVLLALLSFLVARGSGGIFGTAPQCDGTMLIQLKSRRDKAPYTPQPIAGKSIYFILIDRFARSNGNNTACSFTDNNWCNGTLKGITEHLDYIQGMGFEGIWITPVVEQFPGQDGQSGYASHGYWAKNWYEVDPHFGSKADVVELADALHARGMVFILDFVANHMGPVHSAHAVSTYYPFNKPEYYHQLNIGNMTFDQYTEKTSNWPPPAQAMGPGALCASDSRSDCGCYAPACGGAFQPPCDAAHMVFNISSGCPANYIDSICRAGAFACSGYNETAIHEGWFFDLGDLNQSNPFVYEQSLKWVKWMKQTYKLDGLRLDTAPYMTLDFLSALQVAAQVPILGESTVSNHSYHAAFQANPPPFGTPILDGVLNFPLTYAANAAFCGVWWPYATGNLTTLASRTDQQLRGGLYKDLDLLGNFVDNHDMDRLAKMCSTGSGSAQTPDLGRIFNSLAWTFFAKGMPIMYYGTEVFETDQRNSFWQYGWQTDTLGYTFVKRLNMIRKQQHLNLEAMDVVVTSNALQSQLVLRRGGEQGTYAFLNNFQTEQGREEVSYCVLAFPPAGNGNVWVDAMMGLEADVETNCFRAPDSMPRIVYQMPRCNIGAMNPAHSYFYDIECNERSLVGCRADGEHDACRYCGSGFPAPCPAITV